MDVAQAEDQGLLQQRNGLKSGLNAQVTLSCLLVFQSSLPSTSWLLQSRRETQEQAVDVVCRMGGQCLRNTQVKRGDEKRFRDCVQCWW